jgi:hypothetical protein
MVSVTDSRVRKVVTIIQQSKNKEPFMTEASAEKNPRPLDEVIAFTRSMNREVTYAYDDLLFVEHSEIILQFHPEDARKLYIFIHRDISEEDRSEILASFEQHGKAFDFALEYGGDFTIQENKESEDVDIVFEPTA